MNYPQRPLIKIYKDLMVTKRDLIDLRQSITKTIHSIKQSDQEILKIRQKRFNTQRNYSHFNEKKFICQTCREEFESRNLLINHKQEIHHLCLLCQFSFAGSKEDHLLHFCPQVTSKCEFCFFEVKKKEMNKHFEICAFRQCPKCRKDIYLKAFSFHLKECKKRKNNNLISPCKKLPKGKVIRPMTIPCCLQID